MASKTLSINCGEALTIATAAELHQRLNEALSESSAIELVADAVARVDTAGLQLVVSLARELERIGGSLFWKAPSEIVTQSAVTLGLSDSLGFGDNLSKR